jgi:alkanesulfonate monooxygenase SsuD/methylene tetrahydromethanopterin reductase-like flavin-dependent oxidoreductase (luciferase family)
MAPAAGDHRGSIGSAVGRLMSVFDTPEEAEAARVALVAAGIDPAAIEIFTGPDAASAFNTSGGRGGWAGRLYRMVEFSWADQAPDFAWYEAAVREGRVVMSVRVKGQRHVAHVARIIEERGGHFVNHFGWFETQELARWRGKEPDLPGFLRR